MRMYPKNFISLTLALTAVALNFSPGARADGTFWVTNSPMHTGRDDQTATLLPNGKVLVAGGNSTNDLLSSAELYDPASGAWTATGSLNVKRAYHTATLLLNGKVLVAGGDGVTNILSSAELY